MTGPGVAVAMSLVVLGPVVGVLLLAVYVRARHDHHDVPEDIESWRRTTAEVLSVWGPRGRAFVKVRYRVGASLIENDAPCPSGTTFKAGQRIPVRYHPMHPARVVLDDEGAGGAAAPGSNQSPSGAADPL